MTQLALREEKREGSGLEAWLRRPAAAENPSLSMIRSLRLPVTSRVLDMGAGCSRLVDGLLQLGMHNLTLVDVSASALRIAARHVDGISAAASGGVASTSFAGLGPTFGPRIGMANGRWCVR